LSTAGIALAFIAGDLKEGSELIDRALVLNPNLAWAWLAGSWAKVWHSAQRKSEPSTWPRAC
jgi:hypothetical protein